MAVVPIARVLLAHSVTRAKALRLSVGKVAAYSFEHALFLGGLAAMAYGAFLIWHPLGPIIGGWFAVKVALLVSAERKG